VLLYRLPASEGATRRPDTGPIGVLPRPKPWQSWRHCDPSRGGYGRKGQSRPGTGRDCRVILSGLILYIYMIKLQKKIIGYNRSQFFSPAGAAQASRRIDTGMR